MHARLLTILVVAAFALGACGDDENDDGGAAATNAPPPPPAQTVPANTEPRGEVVNVSMKDIKFVPHDITVKVGQTIVWTNDDQGIPHNVTATDPSGLFQSSTMNTGDKFEFAPKEAGKIDYVCTIHSGQDGTITVTE